MKKIICALFSAVLAVAFAVISPIQLSAASKQKYLSEIVVAYSEQECKQLEGSGYYTMKRNINEGNTNPVYLCYKITNNADEAICDIAMMNMAGNYSFVQYRQMLEAQKESTGRMVSEFQAVLAEFKANYNAGNKAAIAAYDMLNFFNDPDSGKKLGELLLSAETTFEQLQTVFLQANQNFLQIVYQALMAGCCDSDEKITDKLAAANIDGEYPETLYETDKIILENIKVIQSEIYVFDKVFALYASYAAEGGKVKSADDYTIDMFNADIDANELGIDDDTVYDAIRGAWWYSLAGDAEYAHSEFTLYEILTYDISALETNEFAMMYFLNPIADSLTPGQVALLSAFSFETMLMFLLSDEQTRINAVKEPLAELTAEYADGVSIYLGVDRSIYTNDDVAMTTEASTEAYANEKYTDIYDPASEVETDLRLVHKITGMVAIAATVVIAAFVIYQTLYYSTTMPSLAAVGIRSWFAASYFLNPMSGSFSIGSFLTSGMFVAVIAIVTAIACIASFLISYFMKKYREDNKTVVVEYEYTKKPRIIVDTTDTGDNGEAEFIFYYAVKDINGNIADINGDDNKTNKYWNVLYYTKDSNAGTPLSHRILFSNDYTAPNGYTPVHDFEKGVEGVKSAVNLNQSSKAQNTVITMYVSRVSENTGTGSVFSSGSGIAALVGAFVLGLAISAGAGYTITKKKKAEENA